MLGLVVLSLLSASASYVGYFSYYITDKYYSFDDSQVLVEYLGSKRNNVTIDIYKATGQNYYANISTFYLLRTYIFNTPRVIEEQKQKELMNKLGIAEERYKKSEENDVSDRFIKKLQEFGVNISLTMVTSNYYDCAKVKTHKPKIKYIDFVCDDANTDSGAIHLISNFEKRYSSSKFLSDNIATTIYKYDDYQIKTSRCATILFMSDKFTAFWEFPMKISGYRTFTNANNDKDEVQFLETYAYLWHQINTDKNIINESNGKPFVDIWGIPLQYNGRVLNEITLLLFLSNDDKGIDEDSIKKINWDLLTLKPELRKLFLPQIQYEYINYSFVNSLYEGTGLLMEFYSQYPFLIPYKRSKEYQKDYNYMLTKSSISFNQYGVNAKANSILEFSMVLGEGQTPPQELVLDKSFYFGYFHLPTKTLLSFGHCTLDILVKKEKKTTYS